MYHELCCIFSEGTPSEGRTPPTYPSLKKLEQPPMDVEVDSSSREDADTPKKKGAGTPKNKGAGAPKNKGAGTPKNKGAGAPKNKGGKRGRKNRRYIKQKKWTEITRL